MRSTDNSAFIKKLYKSKLCVQADSKFQHDRNSESHKKFAERISDVFSAGNIFLPLFEDKTAKEQTNYLINQLCESLKQDLFDRLPKKFFKSLENIDLGLVPISDSLASCLKMSEGEYFIVIHENVYILTLLLAKAVVSESLTGSLERYQISGEGAISEADKLLNERSAFSVNNCNFSHIESIDIFSQVSGHQHNLATITLKFIALHEFAHIVNGDIEVIEHYERNIISKSNFTTEEYWAEEFLADEFALTHLCLNCQQSTYSWANFAQVYMFFKFLSYQEKSSGFGAGGSHPPAGMRIKRMLNWMKRNIKGFDSFEANLNWVDSLLDSWFKGLD